MRRLHAKVDLRVLTGTISRLRRMRLHFELEVLRIKNTLRVCLRFHLGSITISSDRHLVLEIRVVWKCDHHTPVTHLHTLSSDYYAVTRQIDEERLNGNTRSERGVDRFTGPVDRLISFDLNFRIVGE